MQQNYEQIINKFKNMIMRKGKSAKADKIFLITLSKIKIKESKNPFYILQKAIHNTTPVLYFKPQKRGAKIYKLPAPIKESKALFFAIKWIIDSAKQRSEYGFANKLCSELIETSKGNSNSIKKKEDLYKILVDNRPFLKYRY